MPDGPLDILIDSTGLKVFGAGQWRQEKHGAKSRRGRRKLHLAVDTDSGQIVAHTLTDQDDDDPSQVAPLLAQIDGEIAKLTADVPTTVRPPIRRSHSTARASRP